MCKVAIALCKPKNLPHARTLHLSKKWNHKRTSQFAIAHQNSQLANEYHKSFFDVIIITSRKDWHVGHEVRLSQSPLS